MNQNEKQNLTSQVTNPDNKCAHENYIINRYNIMNKQELNQVLEILKMKKEKKLITVKRVQIQEKTKTCTRVNQLL